MGWWGRKKTVVDAEPKTDTLQQTDGFSPVGNPIYDCEASSGGTLMATTTVTIYPTLSGQSGITSVGTGGLGGIAGSYNQYTSVAGQPILQSPQYYYTASQSAGQPVFMVPNPVMPSGYSWHPETGSYMPVNTMPNRSEFTEDEIEQAERIMEELSHA